MEVFFNSLSLILSFDKNLYEIIFLSLKVSLVALFISTIIGLPIAGILASKSFLGKKVVLIFFNSMMALPPVFVGLVLYILFSQSGFFGFMNILYTPMIMIIAQVIIILPIIISVSAELLENIFQEYKELFDTFNVGTLRRVKTTLFDARFSLITCILTGLGRALSEVGAIIIVGGNIVHYTRVMTTTIALETSRGNLSLAIALGIILIFISIMLNYIVISIKNISKHYSYD
ncbi:MAG: ABC transporter permease [Rickettsiales bacterium]|nr:ABC transporter permease [Rickettsiales bacterium]OUT44601.1 MAG: ABC transporter permease [Pelagibacteraceae bacterium TMED13]